MNQIMNPKLKTKKCKIYILYKYYNSFITKKFIGKNLSVMSSKQLQIYHIQLKILYNYSLKCYKLREEYKQFLDPNSHDYSHQLAIDIVKKYNNDVLDYINKIELMSKHHLKYKVNNIYKILDSITNNIDNDNNDNDNDNDNDNNNTVVNHNDNDNYNDNNDVDKDKIKSKLVQNTDDDQFLDDLINQKELEKINVFNQLEYVLIHFNLNYNEYELFFIILELSYDLFKTSFKMLSIHQQSTLVKHILAISKYKLVSLLVRIKSQIDTDDITRINNNEEDFININIVMGGTGGSGHFRVIVNKNIIISQLINIVVSKYNLETDPEVLLRKLCGQKYTLSTHQFYVCKKYKINSSKTIFDVTNDEGTVYLHLC